MGCFNCARKFLKISRRKDEIRDILHVVTIDRVFPSS